MVFFYNLAVRIYCLGILLAFPFSEKARKWLRGRKDVFARLKGLGSTDQRTGWFHCASLGEFEQGRPVIESLKEKHPGMRIVVSFFSPSGYEIRKNYPPADLVIYLPMDSGRNAREFIDLVKPDFSVFVKYEFWYHYLAELNRRGIPVFSISAIFRPGQFFFRWYGASFRKVLRFFHHIFVQDQQSEELLRAVGITEVTRTGDTRFDRVIQISGQAGEIDPARRFAGRHRVIVAGSTWKEDEALLCDHINRADSSLRWILAPHEISENHLRRLEEQIRKPCIRYSDATGMTTNPAEVLIIDNIGMLSILYRYGVVAYIGGGFGRGIHNILEAAVYGMPVIFGPNYRKFREARDLVELGAAFPVKNQDELDRVISSLLSDEKLLEKTSGISQSYVNNSLGATSKIVNKINRLVS